MFGVFIHREDSKYDDHPSERYQFPGTYLARAKQFEGGWVLFYEPTKVPGSRGYYATAKLERIIPDPKDSEMYLALVEPGSYFEFVAPVPFRDSDGLLERGLYNEAGNLSGRAQAAVRPLSQTDFERILDRGLRDFDQLLPRKSDAHGARFQEQTVEFVHETDRRRRAYQGDRAVRNPMFRKLILDAYDETCAFTGLRIINGGGRAEVEAAHIRPVEANGPDSVQNGIALSGTVHWMFDRGLLGLSDDMEIMVSRHLNNRESVDRLIHESMIASAPTDHRLMPHPAFLAWHRENCFKH